MDLASDPNRKFEGAVWLHFSLADVRAKKWIDAGERIPARAREILLDTDSHINLEAIDNGLAGVLADLHYEFDDDPDRLGVMSLYIDKDIVVTARLHPLKVADQLRVQLRGGMVVPGTMRLVISSLRILPIRSPRLSPAKVISSTKRRIAFSKIAFCGTPATLGACADCWRDCAGT